MNDLDNTYCKYCGKVIILHIADWFTCIQCDSKIHCLCLKRLSTPGGLHGDVFFLFTCVDCSPSEFEILERDKMPWFQVVVLVMHHLYIKSFGIAKNGYFHWRMHLVKFIEKNWDILFPKNFKKRKSWTGTIAGILSSYSPYFFLSGVHETGESGWWRLTFPKLSPAIIVTINADLIKEKQKKNILDEKLFVKKQLENYILISTELYNNLVLPQHLSNETNCEITHKFKKKNEQKENGIRDEKKEAEMKSNLNFNVTEAVDQMDLSDGLNNVFTTMQNDESIQGVNLFKNGTHSNFLTFWQKQKKNKSNKKKQRLSALNTEEERLLTEYISKYDSPYCKRLKRKLLVREAQRKSHIKPFDIDNLIQPSTDVKQINNENRPNCYGVGKRDLKIITHILLTVTEDPVIMSSERLSPYTNRILKPYIRRDETLLPPWLQLMLELQHCVATEPFVKATLDFCYVTPNHIPVVNSLCEHFFWPGIDLTEALQYPDFTCVVLYRKLIVAFAFMVPDAKHNETYISFIFTLPTWRRSGIATFMIYHLIQTCMGKDITLHVSVDNPAIFLYQKFGFKVEELVLNFYDNYVHDEDKHSKHAFFLRLER